MTGLAGARLQGESEANGRMTMPSIETKAKADQAATGDRASGDSTGGEARVIEAAANSLLVRLAETQAEIDAALALRYQVFYEEMKAKPTPEMEVRRQDFDRYDDVCDHLLVFDLERGSGPEGVVGTYRLTRRQAAALRGGFYTADEYDVSTLLAYPGNILELGRSCVDSKYRTRMTMQLLWRGIATYVTHFDLALMFGCASFPGTDPAALRHSLGYLYHYHLAPPGLRPVAVPERYVDMRTCEQSEVDPKRAMSELPPLIKGYLRLGGFVGDGAVIDDQFNTTDVCIVVKTDWVTEKYLRHYRRDDAAGRDGDLD